MFFRNNVPTYPEHGICTTGLIEPICLTQNASNNKKWKFQPIHLLCALFSIYQKHSIPFHLLRDLYWLPVATYIQYEAMVLACKDLQTLVRSHAAVRALCSTISAGRLVLPSPPYQWWNVLLLTNVLIVSHSGQKFLLNPLNVNVNVNVYVSRLAVCYFFNLLAFYNKTCYAQQVKK